jgi:DNA-binding transcriptional MerR regulator
MMTRGIDSEQTYSIGSLSKIFNIARSTLLYYESIGLLSPSRKAENNYRFYKAKDILDLMIVVQLKNVGLSLAEIAQRRKSGDLLSDETIGLCHERLSKRIEYLQAEIEVLEDFRNEKAKGVGVFSILQAPVYLYEISHHEPDWDKHKNNPSSNALLGNMPLMGTATLYDTSFLENPDALSWGRIILKKHAHLINASLDRTKTLGGCLCLHTRMWVDSSMKIDPNDNVRKKALKFLAEHDCTVGSGRAFTKCVLHSELHLAELFQPIKPICAT